MQHFRLNRYREGYKLAAYAQPPSHPAQIPRRNRRDRLGFCHHRAGRANRLNEPRAERKLVGIQIICGNCAGDEARPRRTYLSEFDTCVQCGGDSFVLASNTYRPTVTTAEAEPERASFDPKEAVRKYREGRPASPWMN